MIVGRNVKRKPLLIVVIVVWVTVAILSLYAWLIVRPNNSPAQQVSSEKVAPAQPTVPEKIAYGFPTRLVIPKISVNAPVNYMGLTAEGDMESPKGADDVGWYKFGSRPGNPGSAVIAGHLGLREESVFMDLNKLQLGDAITVIDDENRTISFTVKDIRTYGKDEKPDEVFKLSDTPHLNLITCSGEWIESERTYTQRLVIFADKSS